ncbi:MAG TPA: hypothetical protein VE076_00140 [Nitrososphaeraceae archaeon]|nr:hypothetical protein [Nitrososphaeraceae archaeon]
MGNVLTIVWLSLGIRWMDGWTDDELRIVFASFISLSVDLVVFIVWKVKI